MRFYICIILLFCFANAQKRFQPEYFIDKHNLKLPTITKNMLDLREFTHTSDRWIYYYKGNTGQLDTIIENLTIQGYEYSKTTQIYNYISDTVFVTDVTIGSEAKDTLHMGEITYTDNYKKKRAFDIKRNCIFDSKFDERGIKLLDVSKCQNESEFNGQVFSLVKHDNYLESIPFDNGIIDSNNIRRYYLTPFDSIVADYLVEKNREPVFFNFITYNKFKKPVYKYQFDVFRKSGPIISFNYHTYDSSGRLKRIYYFQTKDWYHPENGFNLVNYTEYEYDKLGRKTTMITRVKPDPKYQKKE